VRLFAYRLGWLPPYGMGGVEYWIMPVLANCFHGVAIITRQTRSSMLEVIRSDFVVMARSKGLSEGEVVVRHALPNALIPIIAVAGMNFGGMLGGGLIIEKVFSIPGIGNYLVTAVGQRDFTAVMGGVIITSLFFSLVMLAADLGMAFVDPRVKEQYSTARRRK
jgi:peptide/nickel transport system permease protein